jgi:hypothetical protein
MTVKPYHLSPTAVAALKLRAKLMQIELAAKRAAREASKAAS